MSSASCWRKIRVILPGVELLLGFLIILPFTARDGSMLRAALYLASLLATSIGLALLVAPPSITGFTSGT